MLTDDLIISDMILDSVMVSFKMLGCTSHCMGSGGIVGVVCIAVLIFECSGVFLFVEGTIWLHMKCNAWFVDCVLFMGVCRSFYLFYHIRPPCNKATM